VPHQSRERFVELTISTRSPEELSFSYNGGKDCLVLLILYLVALHARSVKTLTRLPDKLQSVYIVSPHPFPEVEEFVQLSIDTYHLDLARYSKSMRQAFEDYLQDKAQVKAIFVGTRRTDPHGATLKYFDPTDRGWPAFMRIHPVIDWHYAQVWTVSSDGVSSTMKGTRLTNP
jgi:FAD synthetase